MELLLVLFALIAIGVSSYLHGTQRSRTLSLDDRKALLLELYRKGQEITELMRENKNLRAALDNCATDTRFSFFHHLADQAKWSEKTFGPGLRTKGLIDHITKELNEIKANPTDINEWIDVVILGLDGAWRSGHTPYEIINALDAKTRKNKRRQWPDWRKVGEDQAIEHIKGKHD